MDKKQRDEIADKILALNLTEIKAMNRALKYYLKKFRGRYNAAVINIYIIKRETVQKYLCALTAIERNIIEVIMEGYDKGALTTHPYTLVRSVDIHNSTYKYFKERITDTEMELLIGALAMYRATPGIAQKYKKECVELRSKIFGSVVND